MTTAIPRTPEARHESRKRPLLTRLGLLLAAVAGMVTMLSAPAFAGPGDHGTDPLASGCANGAGTIRTGTVGSIFYEIRYSAACGTNWVRVPHLYGTVYMLIRSDWGGSAVGGYQSDSGGGSHWTPQVYAPGSTCITYWVQQIGGGDPATGNVRIC